MLEFRLLAPTESSSTIFALPEGFASQNGNVTVNDENIGGRMVAQHMQELPLHSLWICHYATTGSNLPNYWILDNNEVTLELVIILNR